MPRLTLRSLPVFLVFTVLLAGPARAQCEFDGTVPGTGPSVTAVGVQGVATFYVDDRDWLDLDNDGVAGGIWIYMESNEVEGLQRGGDHPVNDLYREVVCGNYIAPIAIHVPNPAGQPVPVVDPQGDGVTITLFPNGFGGSCYDPLMWYDPCQDWWQHPGATRPDTLLF